MVKELYYNTKGRRDFYKEYSKQIESPLTYKQFCLVFEVIKRIVRLTITDAFSFKIPERLGFLKVCRVGKVKPYHRLDFKTSKERKKFIPHLNLHSNGDLFRFFWDKKHNYASFKHKIYYSFKIIRDERNRYIGKRGLAAYIKKVNNDPNLPNFVASELSDH